MSAQQHDSKPQIIALEKKLMGAFVRNDLETIDELIHDDALFVYPNGLTVTKAMVMENYRSGNSAFRTISASDQIINLIDDVAVVSLNLELKGKYFEEVINSRFRYIRVWKLIHEAWKVVAVSGVPIPEAKPHE
jgi:hypothetical protein